MPCVARKEVKFFAVSSSRHLALRCTKSCPNWSQIGHLITLEWKRQKNCILTPIYSSAWISVAYCYMIFFRIWSFEFCDIMLYLLINPNQTGLFAQSKDRGGGDSPRRFIEVLWPQFSSKFTKNGLKGLLA